MEHYRNVLHLMSKPEGFIGLCLISTRVAKKLLRPNYYFILNTMHREELIQHNLMIESTGTGI